MQEKKTSRVCNLPMMVLIVDPSKRYNLFSIHVRSQNLFPRIAAYAEYYWLHLKKQSPAVLSHSLGGKEACEYISISGPQM